MRVFVTVAMMSMLATACASTTGTESESSDPSTSPESTTSTTGASTTSRLQSTTTSVAMTMDAHSDRDDEASTTTVTSGIRVIEVVMTEMEFTPQRVDVSAGETVRFLVTNEGAIVHEFRLSNPHRIEEHMAGHDDGAGHGESGGHHEDADVVLELDAGASGEVVVTFPGDMSLFTEVACLLPGHYEAGMHAQIVYAG